MHDMDDDTRKEVLGEALMGELKAIREYVEDIPQIKEDVAEIKMSVTDLQSDMKIVKTVLRDHEADIKTLKQKVA